MVDTIMSAEEKLLNKKLKKVIELFQVQMRQLKLKKVIKKEKMKPRI